MAATIEVLDSFAWCGGQGRFNPGALGNGGHEYADYYVGGLAGALALTLGLAFYWRGGTQQICHLWSPPFQPFPSGGCDPGADPPRECVDSLIQLDFGGLCVDSSGGLCFLGNGYFGDDYIPVPFTASSAGAGSAKLVAHGWNYLELKLELAGVKAAGGTPLCGVPDPDPGAFGLMAARINGNEAMRFRARTGDPDKVVFSTCACFLCQGVPLGVGLVRVYSQIYGEQATLMDDLVVRTWEMTDGEDVWPGDLGALFLPIAGAGSAADWEPVGAPSNWQAALENDGATSYNRTNETSKRDAMALQASANLSPVLHAQPVLVGRAGYRVGAGPPVKALYRRGGVDYPTGPLPLPTTFSQVSEDAGVPIGGETVASLSAGEIGYTTE